MKRRRNNELLAIQGQICAENNAAMVGQCVEILVEGEGSLATPPTVAAGQVELAWEKRKARPANLKQLIGRTRGDQIVAFDADPSLVGKLATVRITAARQMTLFAESA